MLTWGPRPTGPRSTAWSGRDVDEELLGRPGGVGLSRGSDTTTVTVYRCPSATGRGPSPGDVDDPDDTATTAALCPPWAPAGGAASPGASAGTTLTDTRTPSSGTLPQLVTVAETPRVPVGGTTAGAAAGTADVGVAHESTPTRCRRWARPVG